MAGKKSSDTYRWGSTWNAVVMYLLNIMLKKILKTTADGADIVIPRAIFDDIFMLISKRKGSSRNGRAQRRLGAYFGEETVDKNGDSLAVSVNYEDIVCEFEDDCEAATEAREKKNKGKGKGK